MRHTTPPPCSQICWEYLDDVRGRYLGGWAYVESIDYCGHFLDRNTGVWKWKRLHPPTPNPYSKRPKGTTP
jgi:hypothetical protein